MKRSKMEDLVERAIVVGVEKAISVLRLRAEQYRRVHDDTAADLLETNADAIHDILLLPRELTKGE